MSLVPDAGADRHWPRPPWIGAAGGMFAVGWGGNQFTPMMVMYEQQQGYSTFATTFLLFAYVLGMIPGLLVSGVVSQILGRKAMMLGAVAISASGSFLLACGASSAYVMSAGRALSGIGLGIGMVVGGVWLTELSRSDRNSRSSAGARRAALSLTGGFALGAAVSGSLAQWAPHPTVIAYLVQIGVCIPVFATIVATAGGAPVAATEEHRNWGDFGLLVMPSAPWVIAVLGVAYGVLPGLVKNRLGDMVTAFSALQCLLALGSGFLCQRVVGSISRRRSVPVRPLGWVVGAAGILVAFAAAQTLDVGLVLVAAVVLGAAYGFLLLGCLEDTERAVSPETLGRATAVFYSVSYLGFGVPALFAFIRNHAQISYPALILLLGAVAATVIVVSRVAISVLRRRAFDSGSHSNAEVFEGISMERAVQAPGAERSR